MDDAVKSQLTEFARRQAGTRLGRTLGELSRSDHDRVTFWPGSAVVAHYAAERLDDPGNDEAVCIFAAERFALMRAAIGYVLHEDSDPQAGSWLVLNDAVVYPPRQRRYPVGFLGIALRPTEAALWTPTQPGSVARRGVSGHKLAV
jgi:hypothetical protein